jgi:peptidoglycan hydrolase-like protein with peptidoglycan-binding domain
MPFLHHAVGHGAANQQADVRVVQLLLNNALPDAVPLEVDGIAGPKTQAAIVAFQTASRLVADGVVGAKGPTLRKLVERQLQDAVAGIDAGVQALLKPVPSDRAAVLAPLLEQLSTSLRRVA